MSNPLKRLVKSLTPQQVTSGKVVARSGASVSVVTAKGVVNLQISGAETYAIGSDVAMRDGLIVGKLIRRDTLPRYYV
jgi:hypothetical protein